MIEEIFFLIETPLSERDYKRFGVELLKARDFKVLFLDLTGMLNPDYQQNYSTDKAPYENIISIHSKKDFEDYFKQVDPSRILGIDLINGRKASFFMYKIFQKYNISYAVNCANSVPLVSSSSTLKKTVGLSKKLFLSIQNNIRAPSWILAGGKKYLKKLPSPDRNSKIIWAHTLDYDLYLNYQIKKAVPLIEGDYAVFLDEYFPYHPDFVLGDANINPYKNPMEYFDELNEIFSVLEKAMDLPIVIAAHPRSQYKALSNMFGDRKIFKLKTLELVAESKHVLAHSSTSINFAVLFNQPITFLLPSKVKNGYYGKAISHFAQQFGKTPLDVGSIKTMSLKEKLFVNQQLYLEYFDNYIKKANSPIKYFWEIVVDKIRS